jgi:GNAT superfamily N-acetyltransferase
MDLNRENISNLTSLWSLAGRADGQYFNSEDYAISSVAESQWPNKLWFHKSPTEKLLKIALMEYDCDGITIPLWQPDVAEEILELHGFTLKNELTGMSKQLNGYQDETNSLSFLRVTDPSSAALWSSLFLQAFGYWIKPSTVVLTMDRVDYLIGNHASQPIGTAVLYRDTPKIAGIHSIGVVPDHRRKGYAADLLNHTLNLAKQQGASHATLQASSMAKELYLKTGFQEDFLLKNFVKH